MYSVHVYYTIKRVEAVRRMCFGDEACGSDKTQPDPIMLARNNQTVESEWTACSGWFISLSSPRLRL